ncbi:MAG: DUF488 family protein, N3 subclade [Kofleriaceae bacterium]
MTLVYSARLTYPGPDRFDITRATADKQLARGEESPGAPFAPSWAVLSPALKARRRADAVMAECKRLLEAEGASDIPTFDPFVYQRQAEDIEAAAWEAYQPAFVREMRASWVQHRQAWLRLLRRPRVVLVCFCTNPEHCHRGLLRSVILPALGAIDGGELHPTATEPEPPPIRRCACGWPTSTQHCAACADHLRASGMTLAKCEPGEVAIAFRGPPQKSTERVGSNVDER